MFERSWPGASRGAADHSEEAAPGRRGSSSAFGGTEAVLFDLDGTLLDSTELILSSHEHTQRHHFNRSMDRRTLVCGMGRPLRETLLDYAVEFGCEDPVASAEAMLETYRKYQVGAELRLMRLFPDVRAMLEDVRRRGFLVGLVTSKMAAVAKPSLVRYGLDALIDVNVFHDDTARHKPHPEPLIEAARRAAVPASRAVYVGDSTHDLAAGRAAGMRTVAALWGPYEREDLEAIGADAYIESPADLVELLGIRNQLANDHQPEARGIP